MTGNFFAKTIWAGMSIVALHLVQGQVFAADITMASGLYKKSSKKLEGKTVGSSSLIGVGGRFSDDLTSDTAWVGEAAVNMRSYTGSDTIPAPDNTVGLAAAVGYRYYFKPFGVGVVPYATGMIGLLNDKTVAWSSTSYTQTTKSGLYYEGKTGIRAGLAGNFFAEIELPLFSNPLFAVTKSETVDSTGKTTSKEEVTDNQLFVESAGKLTAITIGLGMKL